MVYLIIWGFLAPILAFLAGFGIGIWINDFTRFFGYERKK